MSKAGAVAHAGVEAHAGAVAVAQAGLFLQAVECLRLRKKVVNRLKKNNYDQQVFEDQLDHWFATRPNWASATASTATEAKNFIPTVQ